MTERLSVAMTESTASTLESHLLRADGQEDICLAIYRPSTGGQRRTALVTEILPPLPGDHEVHGNATIFDQYVLRAVGAADDANGGIVLAHSHPSARTWQFMSGPDRDAESAFANLAREMTGLPLVGMTLAGRSRTWSARHWDTGVGPEVDATHCESVRVVGSRLDVDWNDKIRQPQEMTDRQIRTVSSWGQKTHNDISRLRVLVVGVGSVGLDVAVRLAATGLQSIGVIDYDDIAVHNLDRMIGATARDVRLRRSKVHVARRLILDAATVPNIEIQAMEFSICEPEGLSHALDYDLIISCVDRPWPRAVLNSLAYTDLIPVVDGGIVIDVFDDGTMRNATWRSHIIRPGRPCMSCNRQLDLGQVSLDIEGLLDDPTYIRGSDVRIGGPNVAALSASVSASLLAQLVSYLVAPGGLGDPGPLQYLLSTHTLESLTHSTRSTCPVEVNEAVGDERPDLTGDHEVAHSAREGREQVSMSTRWLRKLDDILTSRLRRFGSGIRR